LLERRLFLPERQHFLTVLSYHLGNESCLFSGKHYLNGNVLVKKHGFSRFSLKNGSF
jgi:hypothetical protein